MDSKNLKLLEFYLFSKYLMLVFKHCFIIIIDVWSSLIVFTQPYISKVKLV